MADNNVQIKIGADTIECDRALERSGRSVADFGKTANNLGNGLSELKTAFTTLAGAYGIGAFVKASTEAAMQFERFETVMKVSTGSATLAGREMQFIREQAGQLGLDLAVTADSYAKFLTSIKGSSVEGEAGRSIFIGISEGMAALKKSSDESGRIFTQIQQSMSKGKIELEDIKIIAEAGIPIFQLLASAMGKGTDEIMKMMSDGKLLATDVWPKVAEEMHKTFGPAAKEAASGFQAELNRFNTNALETKRIIGEALLPNLNELLRAFNSGSGGIKPFIYTLSGMKIELSSLVDKFIALKDAGGLIGLVTGGKAARAELKAEFDAIDKMAEYSRDKLYKRLNPDTSAQKTAAELEAERARVAAAKAKEQAAKARQDAEKLANEKKSYEEQQYKNELQSLQDASKLRLDELKGRYGNELISVKEYYAAVAEEEQKAYDKEVQRAQQRIDQLKALQGTPGYTDDEKKLSLAKDILGAEGSRDHLMAEYALKRQQNTAQEIKDTETITKRLREQAVAIEEARIALEKQNGQQAAITDKAALELSHATTLANLEASRNKAAQANFPVRLAQLDAEIKAENLLYEAKRRVNNEAFQKMAFDSGQSLLAAEAALYEARGERDKADAIKAQIAAQAAQKTALDELSQRERERLALAAELSSEDRTYSYEQRSAMQMTLDNLQTEIDYRKELLDIINQQAYAAVDLANKSRYGIGTAVPSTGTARNYNDPYGLGSLYSRTPGVPFSTPKQAAVPSGAPLTGAYRPAQQRQSPAAVNVGDIRIELPNITRVTEREADDIARMIFPRIKQYAARYA